MSNNASCGCTAGENPLQMVQIQQYQHPVKLTFSLRGYWIAFLCWIDLFRNLRSVPTGLYYTGETYDKNTPLLVTGNYHLTVFLLWRVLRHRNVRLLIIDTKAINVWCSSGKGQFNVNEMMKQLGRYPKSLLTVDEKIEVILPKLSLSGVSLKDARKAGLKPIIGPVYRYDIPKFLDAEKYADCGSDVLYRFNLRDRLFTLPASLIQFTKYMVKGVLPLFVFHAFFPNGMHWQPGALGVAVAVLFVLLFPLIPGRTFGGKGISLGVALSALLWYQMPTADLFTHLFWTFTALGLSIFYAIYYTGNSGASNYSLVKRDIIRLLPVSAVLVGAAYILIIIRGVTA